MKFAKGALAFAIFCFLCTLSIAAQETQKETRLGSSNIAVDLPTQFAENEDVILYPVNINIDGYQVADYQFSILYDPSVLTATAPSSGCSSAGTMTGDMGLSVTCFIPQPGRINVAVFSSGDTITGSGVLLNIRFTVANEINAPPGSFSNVQLVDELFFQLSGQISSDDITVDDGTVIVVDELEPTAGGVTVGGTALGSDGRALYGARVTLMDANGTTRTALTNPFGYFTFSDVPAGESYVISATARGYTFESTLMTIGDEITDIVLVGQR